MTYGICRDHLFYEGGSSKDSSLPMPVTEAESDSERIPRSFAAGFASG